MLLDKLFNIIENEYRSARSEIEKSFQKWKVIKQIENESNSWERELSKEMVELKKQGKLPLFEDFWGNKI